MNVDTIMSLAASYAVPAIAALLVVWIGFRIAKKIARGVEASLNKAPNADASLSRFFASLVKYLLMLVIAMAALAILGVDTSSVTGIVLASGAALAFILQGSLSNLASGVMLMLFRPFTVGDDVEVGGSKGKVSTIELTATRLKTADNIEIIIANRDVWGGTIKNYTAMGARRLDRNFGISYDGDIDKAIQAITSAAAANPRVHTEPAPWAKVVNLGDSSVDIQLRAWCDAGDYKALSTEISQPVKEALDKAGIGIPYPHEVKIKQHVKNSKGRESLAKFKALKKKSA
jgi:small conductance mechanosensitive channel